MTFTAIKYIGKRPEYVDGTYGTRIHFVQDETKLVPTDKALLMLKHPDVYVLGEAADGMEAPKPKAKTDDTDEEALQGLRDSVAAMPKNALKEFAQANYSVKLDTKKGVTDLRLEVVGLIDQYGVK